MENNNFSTSHTIGYLLEKLDDSVKKISDAAQTLSVSVALQSQKISELQTAIEVLSQTRVQKLENDVKKITTMITVLFGGLIGAILIASIDHGKFFELIARLVGG